MPLAIELVRTNPFLPAQIERVEVQVSAGDDGGDGPVFEHVRVLQHDSQWNRAGGFYD